MYLMPVISLLHAVQMYQTIVADRTQLRQISMAFEALYDAFVVVRADARKVGSAPPLGTMTQHEFPSNLLQSQVRKALQLMQSD